MKEKSLLHRLKRYGISYCVSYTMANMILSVMNYIDSINIYDNVWLINIELSAICLIIAVLMFFSDMFISHTEGYGFSVLDMIVGFFDVAVPVLGLGGFVFNWFDLFSYEVIYPLCIIAAVYFATLVLFLINDRMTEKEINKKIKERKEMKRNEQDN